MSIIMTIDLGNWDHYLNFRNQTNPFWEDASHTGSHSWGEGPKISKSRNDYHIQMYVQIGDVTEQMLILTTIQWAMNHHEWHQRFGMLIGMNQQNKYSGYCLQMRYNEGITWCVTVAVIGWFMISAHEMRQISSQHSSLRGWWSQGTQLGVALKT